MRSFRTAGQRRASLACFPRRQRFFQGYSVKLADTMGIVYTPQEIVDFMCASVAEVLEQEFGKKLWSDDVYIIDRVGALRLPIRAIAGLSLSV